MKLEHTYIDAEFDRFFEFPTDDRSSVSSVSCKLFALAIAQPLLEEIARLRDELERERMRLAACGVVALANTPDSAKEARQMHEDYWSASVSDVARMVDEQIRLRDENAKLRAELDAVASTLPGSYYMDPPDGGSVTIAEQVGRMAKDAEKWREREAKIESLKARGFLGSPLRDAHDSDCATHNEPAYPNGPCDCSAAMQKGE